LQIILILVKCNSKYEGKDKKYLDSLFFLQSQFMSHVSLSEKMQEGFPIPPFKDDALLS
jgi:hypothetical protein